MEKIIDKIKNNNLNINLIIPTFNEAKSIENIVSTFLHLKNIGILSEIYIIDDGSTDKTVEIVSRYDVIVFSRKKEGDKKYRKYNGKGFAIWESLKFVSDDIMVIYDGDVKNPSVFQLINLIKPLLDDSGLILTKANFERNLF